MFKDSTEASYIVRLSHDFKLSQAYPALDREGSFVVKSLEMKCRGVYHTVSFAEKSFIF